MSLRTLFSGITILLSTVAAAPTAPAPPPAAPTSEEAFAARVEAEKLPPAPAPTTPTTFNWDFSQRRDYRYFSNQTTQNHVSSPGREASQEVSTIGYMFVQSGGQHQGQLSFDKTDIRSTSSVNGGKPVYASQSAPLDPIGMLNENGYFETQSAGQQPFVKLIFPAVGRPLGAGESNELPVDLDFTLISLDLDVKGTTRLTNTGYVMFNNRVCARLENEMRVPKTPVQNGAYTIEANGKAISLFSVSDRRFLKSSASMSITLTSIPGAGAPAMYVHSDNFVKIIPW